MITTFVLVSGSIKELANHYGVSYPTMRSRLDRLIERVRTAVADEPIDPLIEYLADLIGRGEIAASAAHRIRDLHRETLRSD